jgi:transcriptional regulator with XRE-family HTH domain
MENAERIQNLRERTGLSPNEVATLVGLSPTEYFDLEFHDDELTTVISLAEIGRLASVFGVPTVALFLDVADDWPTEQISYADLAAQVRSVVAEGTPLETLENEIGWDLGAFLESEPAALSNYGVDFLKDLCGRLGVVWEAALPRPSAP